MVLQIWQNTCVEIDLTYIYMIINIFFLIADLDLLKKKIWCSINATMIDLCKIKEDFSGLVKEAQPWTLTQFVMWLDLKLSEFKIKGYMVLGMYMYKCM